MSELWLWCHLDTRSDNLRHHVALWVRRHGGEWRGVGEGLLYPRPFPLPLFSDCQLPGEMRSLYNDTADRQGKARKAGA